jgi:regulator of replication initiation timing
LFKYLFLGNPNFYIMDSRNTPSSEKHAAQTNSGRASGIAPFVFLTVIAVVLAVAVAVLLQQLFQYRSMYEAAAVEKTVVTDERDDLIEQLNELDAAYQALMVEHTDLSGQLERERAEIARLRRQISSGVTVTQVAEYRARIQELETQLNDYREQVEMLLAENQALSGENLQIRSTLQQTAAQKQALERQKDELAAQVKKASVLRISNLEATPLRERRRGDRETSRARRADKLQFCFTINENPVATAGSKDFFFRLTGPDNQVKGITPEKVFDYQGEAIHYSFKETIQFQNVEKNTCAQWVQEVPFESGTYHVTIFSEGEEVGHAHFELD